MTFCVDGVMTFGWGTSCELCEKDYAHHTNATGSIGGSEGRHKIWDLHVVEGGGLAECTNPEYAEENDLP